MPLRHARDYAIGFLLGITLGLVILKLAGMIDCSWQWVLLPLWVLSGMILGGLIAQWRFRRKIKRYNSPFTF